MAVSRKTILYAQKEIRWHEVPPFLSAVYFLSCILNYGGDYMPKTFRGGVHLEYHKELTSSRPLQEVEASDVVIIPLKMHVGEQCKPLVKKGDRVLVGQKIGDTDAYVGAPVHSSVSGTVQKIDTALLPSGLRGPAIFIENDGLYEVDPSIRPKGLIEDLTPRQITDIIREAGIVGLGGACFPTHVKLCVPEGKHVEYLLVNAAECEPYLTCDHRTMLERTEDLFYGIKAAAKACGADHVIICVEDNKPDAIEIMQNYCDGQCQVVVLETKYPQGGERQLIKAVLNREVPSGTLPYEVGVVVINVGTAVAIAEAIKTGMPLIKRAVTVTGTIVKNPGNFIVRIGTTMDKLRDVVDGTTEPPSRIIYGGPMMGNTIHELDEPVVKGTSGVVVLSRDESPLIGEPDPCISCARCVDHCPAYLMPNILERMVAENKLDKAKKLGLQDCIECGTCSYVCPSKRHLVQWFRVGKMELAAQRRREGDKAKAKETGKAVSTGGGM